MQRMEPETPRPDRTNLRCGNHGVDSRVIFVIRLQQNGEKPQNLACYAVWVLHEITIEQRKVFRNSIGKASTESVARNGHAFSNGRVHEDSTYTSTLLVAPSRTCTNVFCPKLRSGQPRRSRVGPPTAASSPCAVTHTSPRQMSRPPASSH